jgi:hypothetical protein
MFAYFNRPQGAVMKSFLQRFGALVLGVLLGFDRWRFRGSKRRLCYPEGVMGFLSNHSVLLKDFNKPFAKDMTATLCASIEQPAKKAGIYCYLDNSKVSKEETALAMAQKHGKKRGLIAVLGCLESCQNLRVRKNRATKMLEMRIERGKCLHYYHYYLDPQFGLRYTRLQSWFPFTMHIGLNGRDWLARQMTKAGIDFVQKDNCFTWIEDFEAAQHLMDQQLQTAWQPLLDHWARQSFRLGETLLPSAVPYYWSVQEAEFATDVVFRSPEDLAKVYPLFVQHAYASLRGQDLLQFMNYRVRPDGRPLALGEVKTTIKELVAGTCVRHHVLRNLLKMYDKMMGILRIESMLLDLEHFKVFRTKEGDDDGPMSYRRLRKGVADMHRRAEVSAKINDRYLSSLASVEEKQTLAEVTTAISQRVEWQGRKHRALNPLAPEDASLFEAVSRGEFMIDGFSNRQIRAILYPQAESADAGTQKRLSAKVTRLLRLLRAHGLITKVPKTHRYQLTETGRSSFSIILAARASSTKVFLQAA